MMVPPGTPRATRGFAGLRGAGARPRRLRFGPRECQPGRASESFGTKLLRFNKIQKCFVSGFPRIKMLSLLVLFLAFVQPLHSYSVRLSTLVGARRCYSPIAIAGESYMVRLQKPLGIIFEEETPGKAEGVTVAGLVEGGRAELDGRILVGDKLIRVSAVQFGGQQSLIKLGDGAQFTSVERNLIPVTALPFDVIMSAIASNEGRYGYTDVALELQRTDQSVPRVRQVQRSERKDEATVEWDGAKGTTVNGVSTPLKPGKDNF